MRPERIQAILFDLDGTLIDTDQQVVIGLARRLSPVARFLKRDPDRMARRLVMWAETPGNALFTVFDWLGLDDNLFAIGDTLRRWRGVSPRFGAPMTRGAIDVLRHLKPRYRLGIVTTRGRRDAEAFLTENRLNGTFETVVTRQSFHRLKPHPGPVELAARCLNLTPAQCVVVGDTAVDMRSAQAAGAWALGVLCGFGERDELKAAGADVIVPDISDILEVLIPS